jgi:hypothetical protein
MKGRTTTNCWMDFHPQKRSLFRPSSQWKSRE